MDPVQVLVALANLSVIIGIGLGLLQLRAIARQRQEDMVLRAFEPFLDPAFSRAFWEVQTWRYTTFEQFDAEATLEDLVTLDVVSVQFETMGLLYKRGLAELDFLDDLMAEPTLMTWNRIAPIVYGYRAKANVPGWSQWHERLAVALDKRLTELGEPHEPLVKP
ncbi:MAG: hypothetical protein EPO36_01975, partial [Chloroflexota bacterium]